MTAAHALWNPIKIKDPYIFAVSNLLPSASLLSQGNREYRLILMGVDEGELFIGISDLFCRPKRRRQLFKKFTGPTLECYTHCLLVSADRADGSIETIMSGGDAFFSETRRRSNRSDCAMSIRRDLEKYL